MYKVTIVLWNKDRTELIQQYYDCYDCFISRNCFHYTFEHNSAWMRVALDDIREVRVNGMVIYLNYC